MNLSSFTEITEILQEAKDYSAFYGGCSELQDNMNKLNGELTALAQHIRKSQVRAFVAEHATSEPAFCAICRCTSDDSIALSCAHSFCPQCTSEWLQRGGCCPLCKRTIRLHENIKTDPDCDNVH